MLPLLLIAATVAGAAVGAFAEHKRAFKVAFKAGRLVGLEEGYGDAIRDGWAQHTAAIASGVTSPSRGWSDLYDVDYGTDTSDYIAQDHECNDGNPTVWSDAVPPGGRVCAVQVSGMPGGFCGVPVESEPCSEHTSGDGADAAFDSLPVRDGHGDGGL